MQREQAPVPGVEVIVVAYGRPDLLERTLAGLQPAAFPVTVVDNSSSAAVRAVALAHGASYRDPGANLGFARAVNLGLGAGPRAGRDVLLLNPDAEVDPPTVEALQRRLRAEPRLAAVAPAQHDPAGRAQRVAWPFPTPGRAWLAAAGLSRLADRGPQFLIGSVLLLRAEAVDEVGGLDERYFLYAEEADWQWRAHLAGWRVRLCPELHATHVSGATSEGASERREALFHAGQERYIRTWFGPAGWQSYRMAALAGAALRAAVTTGGRRRAARARAACYLRGPSRVAAAHLPAGPDLSGGPDVPGGTDLRGAT